MIDFFTPDNILFTASFFIQILSVFLSFIIKNEKKALYITNSIFIIGLLLGLLSTIHFLMLLSTSYLDQNIFLLNNLIRLDRLGLFFLFIVQLISIPITLYNFSYLPHYIKEDKSIRSFIVFYFILLISTQLVVIANHAIFFLVCWEMMTLSAYLGMILEKEKEEVQSGSFYFIIASHFLIFFLYIFFFLLHHFSGSWFFSDYNIISIYRNLIPFIFILAFIGFGTKAGFMPFHFWLPQAHPIAPTVLSAFLSGIIIKIGIYGILRTIQFLNPIPIWCGWLVIIVSLFSAIFGVWYALAQHDIKRLLAYHSVENIGIIGIGIGIGLIGKSNNLPAVQVLGFGGAILHTLNHAIFKSLLFIGSGVICQNLGIRNIELMGGIVKRSRYLSIFFLIGSIAICGIPPFNGFISEFIIFKSFFQTAIEIKNNYPLFMLMLVVGLAFVGGLAVACFTKVNSIIFLGAERKPVKHFHTNTFDYISLGFLGVLCILIGFYPEPLIKIIQNIVNVSFIQENSSQIMLNMNWTNLTFIVIVIFLSFILLYLFKVMIEKKYGRRVSAAWGCGYENLNSRMQYTASSFADELNTIPKNILGYHKKIEISKGAFPKESRFESHSKDIIDEKIILPSYIFLKSIILKIKFLSNPDIRYSIAFILVIITIYCLMGFLWT